MAFAAPNESSAIEQVYRVSLSLGAKPEVVSVDGDGHLSNGSCTHLRFLTNGDLEFDCASTNLLEGSGVRSFRKTGDAPLVASSSS